MKKFKLFKGIKSFLSTTLISMILLTNSVTFATTPNVSPSVDEIIPIGDYVKVDKSVETPEIPPLIDIMFLYDLSGSFGDDLPNIQSGSSDLFDAIAASGSDFRLGVSSFIDYPVSPFGSAGDYPYNLDLDFTNDKGAWTGSLAGLSVGNGGDFPESQYEAIVRSTASGSWRPDAKKVIVIATDAAFHQPTDPGYPSTNGSGSALTALDADDITLIGLRALGAGLEMDELAAATGGEVLDIASDSSDIADAILEGLGNLPITVVPDASACAPLSISFLPPSQTVTSGDTAYFDEFISVPNDPLLGDTVVTCEVVFNDEDGNEIGRQSVRVYIPDTTAPVAACRPTTNPSGANIPKAGEKSKGQNEDGFYQVGAWDNADEDPEIFINGFGPFAYGDKVKITEAPGATPKMKEMGSSSDEVIAHLILDSDAFVTAVDDAGNVSDPYACLVPPLPK